MFWEGGAGDELAFERVVRCRVWDAEDEVPDLGRKFGRERGYHVLILCFL